MFYSTQILAKKGPLGLVWIAAHLDRQLKRQQINDASVTDSVNTLLEPEAPLALRLSGQLMLGVVRIYARKVRYLQEDATEALAHIRMALRAAAAHASVDLPPGDASAPADTITLPRGDLLLSGLEGGVWDLDEDWGAEGGGGAGAGLGAGLVLGGGRFGVLDLAISMPSGSARLSNDLSEVFGMGFSSQEDERFDEAMEGLEPFDLNDLEVERLRAAPSTPAGVGAGLDDLVVPASLPSQGKQRGADSLGMEAGAWPMELELEPDAEAPLASHPGGNSAAASPATGAAAGGGYTGGGSSGRGGEMAWTPGSMDGPLGELLPTPQGALDFSLRGDALGGDDAAPSSPAAAAGTAMAAEVAAAGAGTSRARAAPAAAAAGGAVAAATGRGAQVCPKRRVVVDAKGSAAAITLPGGEMRALLSDRSVLLDKERVQGARAKRAQRSRVAAVGAAANGAAANGAAANGAAASASDAAAIAAMLEQPAGAGMAGGLVLPSQLQQLCCFAPAAAEGAEHRQQQLHAGAMEGGAFKGAFDEAMEEQLGVEGEEPVSPAATLRARGGAGWDDSFAQDGEAADGMAGEPHLPSSGGGAVGAFSVGLGSAGDDFLASGGWAGGSSGLDTGGGTGGVLADATNRMMDTGAGPSKLAAVPWPDDAECLMEEQNGEEGLGAAGALSGSGVTARTRLVMRHLAAAAGGAAASGTPVGTPMSAGIGGKRKRVSAAASADMSGGCDGAAAGEGGVALSFNTIVARKGRLDACRWFYEMLVLGNKDLVGLQQGEAYGDISVTPRLRSMAAA